MTEESITIFLADANATRRLGITLGQILDPGNVILLSGDLGSGKTTLVQGIAEGLGITEPIVSPTFTLINEYLAGKLPLYHLDLYRLQPKEVTNLNLESYWEGVDFELGIVAIEWAERLEYKPPNYLQFCLKYQDNGDAAKGKLLPPARQVEIFSVDLSQTNNINALLKNQGFTTSS
ncbi:MAG: tRNA (adenosine(37)-N6)-threonylcarbamoyltransferase complex ATPase subunit type 1 TsaE [Gloeocapsa sp. UFS-A4-WI-NPMV-4B04]|jgi:tRNA threonylcarbamoyladenosine biosynthesis protein TsaE|nr:tRNA (adenosine(37)-N6)-threonylcarbamoyltransferase complex ATPase subunit type 1 TsaE [Gloeocapsa sp. UFS-A4-WI-NPMV-4B04]